MILIQINNYWYIAKFINCELISLYLVRCKKLMNKGKIIYLNGVTSTGKTTLSKAIQQMADMNFYHMSFDMFQQMISMKFLNENYWKCLSEAIIATYHTAKILSDMNINVIVDGMLLEMPEFQLNYKKSHYEIFKSIFSDCPLLLIEVFCPLEECKKRNIHKRKITAICYFS